MEPTSVIEELTSFKKQLNSAIHNLTLRHSAVGLCDLINIMKFHLRIKELDVRYRETFTELSDNKLLGAPLVRVVLGNGDVYNITIARIDKLVVGEYDTIENLLSMMGPETDAALNLEDQIQLLCEILVDNSLKLYDSVKSKYKLTPKGKKFKAINPSSVRKYLYFYPGDKKKTLGFIALKASNQ